MIARIPCVCSLLLLCVAATVHQEKQQVGKVDELFAAEVLETQRAFVDVEKQLSGARQVAELFALEDTQLQLFALETQAKLVIVQKEVKKEMETALLEVEKVRQKALENVTTWEKTLRELEEATESNRQTLQSIREQKQLQRQLELQKEQEMKVKRELEMLQELEREKQLERQAEEELKKVQELDKQRKLEEVEKHRHLGQFQELEKQRELKKMQELEKMQQEKQRDQEIRIDLSESSHKEEDTQLSDDAETVKRVVVWYVSVERTMLEVYRQLVLPVVAILGVFLVLTIVIARYNSMKQARRNRRVLYSGYPKTYRRKVKQHEAPATADEPDLRPHLRHSVPRHDPNGFFGD